MKAKDDKKESAIIKFQKDVDRYGAIVIMLSCFFVATVIGLIVFTQMQTEEKVSKGIQYKRHYMFVNQTGNSYISDRIYEEAKSYGKQNGVYVEQLGSFSESDYEIADYLKMAMAMKVDGIILEGEDEDDVRMTINQASAQGIPVVTILSDCAGSRRKSFIELGDYNLGKQYGQQIINVAKTRKAKVVLFMHETTEESEHKIVMGIQEVLKEEGKHLQVDFRTEQTKSDTQFSTFAQIKKMLTNEETRPDILICMNEKDTQMVYQSLIDYELEGKVQIIGSCVSESLIKAVRDGGIAALIDVDTVQAGVLCVDALSYYIEEGSVKDHISVDEMVITKENVERYIEDE